MPPQKYALEDWGLTVMPKYMGMETFCLMSKVFVALSVMLVTANLLLP